MHGCVHDFPFASMRLTNTNEFTALDHVPDIVPFLLVHVYKHFVEPDDEPFRENILEGLLHKLILFLIAIDADNDPFDLGIFL
jgi:hypothetical protein